MNIEQIGPWLLLAAGLAMLGAATVAACRGQAPKGPWIFFFGFASAGCGVWGPGFLDYYAKLAPIFNMQQFPDAESYADVFAKIGDGSLSPEYQELAVAYALDRPIDNMDEVLDGAIKAAPDPGGKAVLEQARQEWHGKKLAAKTLAATITKPPGGTDAGSPDRLKEIARFDSATRMLVAGPLLKEPTPKFSQADREKLKRFAAPRRSRTQKNRPSP